MGHLGYCLCFFEYAVTDILILRLFAVSGCTVVVLYALMQYRVQTVTVGWCTLYNLVNAYQIHLLVSDSPPRLTWEEERLHAHFEKQLTATQFGRLMATGEWIWLMDGAFLSQESLGGSDRSIFFVASGVCEVAASGNQVAELGPGSIVGEVAVLSEAGHPATATVQARGPVRCFVAPARKVLGAMEEFPDLRLALRRLVTSSLASKLRAEVESSRQNRYKAVLELACSSGQRDALESELEGYRQRHAVPAALHNRLLEGMPQCAHKKPLLDDVE